jgi:hypothetical protein
LTHERMTNGDDTPQIFKREAAGLADLLNGLCNQ